MQLPCKNRQVYLHRLFSKALEAAHLRFKRRAVRLLFRILTAESRCGFCKLLTG